MAKTASSTIGFSGLIGCLAKADAMPGKESSRLESYPLLFIQNVSLALGITIQSKFA
jgi:hypothetical protein